MEKKFKHRKTGEIITYKDGVIKSGTLALDMGCEPSSEYWEEVKKTYPIGTKVRDWLGKIYEKKEDGWFRSIALLALNESEIGEGKYYQVIEEPKKGYEILSYKQNISNRLYKKDFNDNFIADNGWSLSKPIDKHTNISIHSVRRLSDNSVFTIGDKIEQKEQICKNAIIESFNIGIKGEMLAWVYNTKPEFKVGLDINIIQKSKPVLFTSFDGVDIYEGDDYYVVFFKGLKRLPKGVNLFEISEKFKAEPLSNEETWSPNTKLFSSKKAAEEYVLMNKPCLSINDLESTYFKEGNIREQLKQLVKSKL